MGEAAGLEQAISFAQWDVERLGEREKRLPARLRASGFDETDMTRGEASVHGEIELAHAARGSPVAQQLPDNVRLRVVVWTSFRGNRLHMPIMLRAPIQGCHYLGRNCE